MGSRTWNDHLWYLKNRGDIIFAESSNYSRWSVQVVSQGDTDTSTACERGPYPLGWSLYLGPARPLGMINTASEPVSSSDFIIQSLNQDRNSSSSRRPCSFSSSVTLAAVSLQVICQPAVLHCRARRDAYQLQRMYGPT